MDYRNSHPVTKYIIIQYTVKENVIFPDLSKKIFNYFNINSIYYRFIAAWHNDSQLTQVINNALSVTILIIFTGNAKACKAINQIGVFFFLPPYRNLVSILVENIPPAEN